MSLVPQFGFLELLLIAIVALIVVGPRDLPSLMRQAGRMVGKARAMASEFTAAFDQMARETEMEDLRKELDALKNDNAVTRAKRDLDESLKPVTDDLRKETDRINHRAAAEKGEAQPAAKASSDTSATAVPETGGPARQ